MASEATVRQFMEAPNSATAEQVLGQLLFDIGEPVIRKALRSRLSSLASHQDLEDLSGDRILELAGSLQACRAGDSEPISNLTAYAAVAAEHACDRFLSLRHPAEFQFRNRLRYFIENTKGLIAWETPHGERICGFVDDRGKAPLRMPAEWFRNASLVPGGTEGGVVKALLEYASPITFEDLAGAAAAIVGIARETAPAEPLAPPPVDRMDRLALERFWSACQDLPAAGRRALLLHFRDDEDGSALVWLPAAGVATLRDIATALAFDPAAFARLWPGLPMNDLQIAALVGVSRQQVISLRKSARQYVGRKLGSEWTA